MSNVNDRWVTMAMADDTLVADQLLLLRHHHRPSVIRRWVRRQRRTPRLPVAGYEGNTRKTALTHPSASKVTLFFSFYASLIFRKLSFLFSYSPSHSIHNLLPTTPPISPVNAFRNFRSVPFSRFFLAASLSEITVIALLPTPKAFFVFLFFLFWFLKVF